MFLKPPVEPETKKYKTVSSRKQKIVNCVVEPAFLPAMPALFVFPGSSYSSYCQIILAF